MTPKTNVTTSALRTLHRMHRQLGDLKERLRRGPRVVDAHQRNLESLQAKLDEVKNKAMTLRVATDEKQLQLGSKEAGVEKRRLQLRQAGDNREYQALKTQIAADEMANSVLADEILEAMEKLDEFDQKVARTEAAVAQARQQTETSRADVQRQEPLIQADVQRIEQELETCENELSGDFREMYRRVVRVRGEDALAMVTGDVCGGCNQRVRVNMINNLMLSRPIFCEACGRLLYLPEDYSPR